MVEGYEYLKWVIVNPLLCSAQKTSTSMKRYMHVYIRLLTRFDFISLSM